ncbi:MAG TPA: hypothetical protein VFG86_22095, partial [Chloroflexota bacterium]|nr:hypothetical protein [Chloroflexota bacterium]
MRLASASREYAEAAQWDLAVGYARQAGERALRMYAPRAALEQLSRALHACSGLGRAPDPELLRLRGQAHDLLGHFEQAEADYTAAREAAQTANDRAAEWRVLLDLTLLWAGRSYD